MDPQDVDVERAEHATTRRQKELQNMNFSERDAQLLAMTEYMAEHEGWQMSERFGECHCFSDRELYTSCTSNNNAYIEPIGIIGEVSMEHRVIANVSLRYRDPSRNRAYTTVMDSGQYQRLKDLHQAREAVRLQAAGEHAANLRAGWSR